MNTSEVDTLIAKEKKSFARWMKRDNHSYNDLEERVISRMREAYELGRDQSNDSDSVKVVREFFRE